MSELAFNLNGDPFEVPAGATRWRVKKMKPKGPPEVVFGRDGIPLTLSIDAGMDELRHEARAEGRYRLDLVDDLGQAIPGAASAYVCVQPDGSAAELAPLARPLPSENAVIEAMRMNAEAMRMTTELARSIIDRFPAVMDSTAGILGAADGAGLPAREPRALPEPPDDDDDELADDDDEPQAEAAAPKPSGWMGLLETLIPLVAPVVMSAVAKFQIPGGVGALFDCRRASPKASAAAPRATSTPGVAPAPGPRDPAPARRGTSPVHPRPSNAPGAPRGRGSVPHDPTTGAAHADVSAANPTAATEASSQLPTLDSAAEASSQLPTLDSVAEASSELPTLDSAAEASSQLPTLDSAAEASSELPPLDPDAEASSGLAALDPAAEASNELPTLGPAAFAHFGAIQAALTFREGMLARALAAELSPADLRTWFAELQTLSVPDAVARIRAVLGPDASGAAKADASQWAPEGKPSDLIQRLDDLCTAIRGAPTSDRRIPPTPDPREPSRPARSAERARSLVDSSSDRAGRPRRSPRRLGAIGSMPREQLLELVVGGLRSMLAHRAPTYHARPVPAPTRSTDTSRDAAGAIARCDSPLPSPSPSHLRKRDSTCATSPPHASSMRRRRRHRSSLGQALDLATAKARRSQPFDRLVPDPPGHEGVVVIGYQSRTSSPCLVPVFAAQDGVITYADCGPTGVPRSASTILPAGRPSAASSSMCSCIRPTDFSDVARFGSEPGTCLAISEARCGCASG